MNNFTKLLLIFCFLISLDAVAQPFITKWDLSIPGSGPTQISFGVGTTGVVNYTWETIPAGTNGSGTFTGATATITGLPAGTMIRLSIDTAHFNRIHINFGSDKSRLIDVQQWGGVHWNSMEYAFYGCNNLNCTAIDLPDLGAVTSINSMFKSCTVLNGPSNIGSWNTANITNMSYVFFNASNFNQPIGNWNTANVTNMSYLFFNALNFNQPIGSWNTQNVTNMWYMFSYASVFNQPIGSWNTQSVIYMGGMFANNSSFNQPIGAWNTQNVTDMSRMFLSTASFNQPIGSWNTQNVTDMSWMFAGTTSFDQPIGTWNTQSVLNMEEMFNSALVFNQPIGTWNTQSVQTMKGMFSGNSVFNQPIDSWNTSNVTEMLGMFASNSGFNQPIGSWNTQNVLNMGGMFANNLIFNQPIGTWNTQSVGNMGQMFSNNLAFNQPIGTWNTQNVWNMSQMFSGATNFNQPIGSWNTQNVQNMSRMFEENIAFNQPIGNWNISNVIYLNFMFKNAVSFNQPLGNWVFNSIAQMNNLLDSSAIDCENYTNTLIGWSNAINMPNNKIVGASSMKYKLNAINARNYLINTRLWTIIGDTLDNDNCCVTQQYINNLTTCTSYFFNGQTQTTSGLYYDTLINVNGCDSIISLNLTINQVNTTVTQSGANLSSNAVGATYQWLSCNPYQIIPGATNQTFTANANGDYAVIVTQNGCTDTSACVTVMGIGLDEYSNDDKIIIYPNPAHDKIYISSKLYAIQNTKKELYNTLGQVILTTNENEIDVSNFVKGVYYVRCGRFVEKVIVE
jgi:surface protein